MAEDKEREITPGEEKARTDGWVPKDEWVESGNESESWVDYGEFNFRGELMDRIKSQTKSLRSRDSDIEKLGKAIKELGDHNRKIAEVEYKRAIRELKQQKLAALKDENPEAVLEIEDQIDELKDREAELKATPEPAQAPSDGPPQEFVDWHADPKNSWYTSDVALSGAANALIGDYQLKNPEASPSEALAHMERAIKEEFPHKFGTSTTKPKTSKVTEPGSNGASKTKTKSKYTKSDLSEEQYDMAKTFEMRGALSVQEYVDQLAEMGQLPSQIG